MDNMTRTNGLEDKPVRGELEIERLDSGYVVSILTWGEGWDTPPVRLAFEDVQGVADEVMRWLGYEVHEDEEEYVLTDKVRERLDALKRGSGRYYPRGVETGPWGGPARTGDADGAHYGDVVAW